MQIALGMLGEAPVVRLSGDMRLWGKQGLEDKIRDAVYALVVKEKKQVVLSLAGVTHIDSRGIGCLARCLATACKNHAVLHLVASGHVLKTLRQMGFRRVTEVFEDETSAGTSFTAVG